jgi:hypothetical protein
MHQADAAFLIGGYLLCLDFFDKNLPLYIEYPTINDMEIVKQAETNYILPNSIRKEILKLNESSPMYVCYGNTPMKYLKRWKRILL